MQVKFQPNKDQVGPPLGSNMKLYNIDYIIWIGYMKKEPFYLFAYYLNRWAHRKIRELTAVVVS